MVDLITENGMLAGLKVDCGYDKTGIPGTAVGALGHPETWCKGLDDLEKRCTDAYAAGARFAKWRNVLQVRAPPTQENCKMRSRKNGGENRAKCKAKQLLVASNPLAPLC